MFEGPRTNTNIVWWIALAAYMHDSKKYYASIWPWLALYGLAFVTDEMEEWLCRNTPPANQIQEGAQSW